MVKVLVQVYRDSHMESEIDQYYMDLADDHHHEHVVGYLSQRIPFSEAKGEPPLTALTYSCLGVWAHHLLLTHMQPVKELTHCLCRCVHTVVCSSMPAGASATATTHLVSQRVVHIWTYLSRLLTQVKQHVVAWGKTDQTASVFIKIQCIQLHAWHAYIVHIAFFLPWPCIHITNKWHTV